METVDAAEAGVQFEALLARVEHEHKTVILMRGDREVARLEPSPVSDPLARFRFPGQILSDLDEGPSSTGWELD